MPCVITRARNNFLISWRLQNYRLSKLEKLLNLVFSVWVFVADDLALYYQAKLCIQKKICGTSE